jgi:hypothetical protein
VDPPPDRGPGQRSSLRSVLAGIRQLADVAAGQGPDDGLMEIRIILNLVEPPCGRLRAVPDAGCPHGPEEAQEIRFTGWLELLRTLYEVTGVAGSGHADSRTAGSGPAGSGPAGSGTAGSGTAGSGTAAGCLGEGD